ncbi:MAG: glycosyltransferase family 4 protein [Cognatishimia activa]
MSKPRIVHLLDDTTTGGVTRVVTHICNSQRLANQADHEIRVIPKNAADVPVIEADLIVSHLTVSWRGLAGLIALRAKHPNISLIHVEHSYTQSFTALNVAKRERFFSLLRTAYSLFDTVVGVSRAQYSWLVTRDLVASERSCVIRSAVDLSAFARLEAPTGPCRVFGAIGRLEPQKGFDTLIMAFSQCQEPDARLRIFGRGGQHEELERMAQIDPRITLEGHAPDPVRAMSEVQAVLLPSRWEAYGLVAQEALAARRRTLVAPVDGLCDQLEDGAHRVARNTVADWTRAIDASLTADLSKIPDSQARLSERVAGVFERNWEGLIARSLVKELPVAA